MGLGLIIGLALCSAILGWLSYEIEGQRKMQKDERMVTVEEEK